MLPTIIATELKLRPRQVAAAVELLDEGATVTFIARYRKEATGGLDEEQLRQIEARADYLRKLEARKAAVRAEIESQGKLTPDLDAALRAAATLQQVEDLYRPFKPKAPHPCSRGPGIRIGAAGGSAVCARKTVGANTPGRAFNRWRRARCQSSTVWSGDCSCGAATRQSEV